MTSFSLFVLSLGQPILFSGGSRIMRRGVRALSDRENFETTPTFGDKPRRLFSCIYKGECTSCWLIQLMLALFTHAPGAHNQKERPTQYICSIPTYDQNPLKFLSGKVHVWKSKPSPYSTTPSPYSTTVLCSLHEVKYPASIYGLFHLKK